MEYDLQINAPREGPSSSNFVLPCPKHADNGEMVRVQVSLILVLSGCDGLEAKLNQGVSFRNYVTSYGDRANDLSTVTKCMSDLCPCSSPIRELSIRTSQTSRVNF